MNTKEKVQMVCCVCGSADVSRDAEAAWDADNQRWELKATYDNATCEECGGETTLEEMDYDSWNLQQDEDDGDEGDSGCEFTLEFASMTEEEFRAKVLQLYPQAHIFRSHNHLVACYSEEDRELVGEWNIKGHSARVWPGYGG